MAQNSQDEFPALSREIIIARDNVNNYDYVRQQEIESSLYNVSLQCSLSTNAPIQTPITLPYTTITGDCVFVHTVQQTFDYFLDSNM